MTTIGDGGDGGTVTVRNGSLPAGMAEDVEGVNAVLDAPRRLVLLKEDGTDVRYQRGLTGYDAGAGVLVAVAETTEEAERELERIKERLEA